MKRALVLCVVAGVLVLFGAVEADEPVAERRDPEALPAKAISDAHLSLYSGSLFAVPDPTGFSWNDDDPGGNDLLPRAFAIAPPRIPHGIASFEPLTAKTNGCLDCHALGAGADAPELPPSHRTDLRSSPENVGSTVAGARYLCLACHVPTSDAAPLRTTRLPAP